MPISFVEVTQAVLDLVQEREQLKAQLAEKDELIKKMEIELKRLYSQPNPESGLKEVKKGL
jgi:hypothetical protein